MDWSINKIAVSDLTEVVNIHIQALPNDVLPSLGENVLNKYYKKALSDETQVIFGAYHQSKLLGFCLVSTRPISLVSVVFNIDGLVALLKLALIKPREFYLGIMQAVKKEDFSQEVAEISFIAVSPKYQGKSIGRDLIGFATQWGFNEGIKYFQTKTANELLLTYYIKEYAAEVLSSYNLCGKHYSEVRWVTLPKRATVCPA